MTRLVNAAAVVVWFAFLGALLFALSWLGAFLPIPGLGGLSAWFVDTPVIEMALTAVRLVCFVGITYVLVASLITVLVEVARIDLRIAALESTPLRRLLRSALGVSLAATTLAPLSPATAAVTTRDYPILHHVDPHAGTTSTMPTAPSTTLTTTPTTPFTALAPHTVSREVAPAVELKTHIVVSGDSLWSIAEETFTQINGRKGSSSEIADLTQRIAKDNRDQFVDTDNPDLIFPGQVFRLPRS